MASTPSDSSTAAPTDAQVQAAQAVIAAAATAKAAADAARIKPVTDFVSSDVAKRVRDALEALLPDFIADPTFGVHINCALTGLRGLGVPTTSAS